MWSLHQKLLPASQKYSLTYLLGCPLYHPLGELKHLAVRDGKRGSLTSVSNDYQWYCLMSCWIVFHFTCFVVCLFFNRVYNVYLRFGVGEIAEVIVFCLFFSMWCRGSLAVCADAGECHFELHDKESHRALLSARCFASPSLFLTLPLLSFGVRPSTLPPRDPPFCPNTLSLF